MAIENVPSEPTDTSRFVISAFDITSRTLSVWFRRLLEYVAAVGIILATFQVVSIEITYLTLGIGGLSSAPSAGADAFSLVLTIFQLAYSNSAFMLVLIGLAIAGLFVSAIVTGAGIKLAYDDYGNPGNGSVGESLSTAIERAIKLIGIGLLRGLIIGLFFIPMVAVMLLLLSVLSRSISNPYALMAQLQALMGPLFVSLIIAVVGIYMMIRLIPAMAVGTIEDLGIIDSIKRAYRLTSGNFWHVFGSFILIGLVVGIIELIISFLIASFFFDYVLTIVISGIIEALFFSAINIIYNAVLYKDLYARSMVTEGTYW